MSSSYQSRIRAAAAGPRVPDDPGSRGSFGDLGPGSLAVQEWTAAGLVLPDLDRLRSDRLARLRVVMDSFGYSVAVLTDPINVRYATDSTNMSIWGLHNQARYAVVALDGPVVLFDFHGSEHLSAHLPLVDEVRHGRSWFFFETGEHTPAAAQRWASEIADLITAHGGGNRRVAIDKVEPDGLRALARLGIEVGDGQAVAETARMVKGPEEIRALRCACAATAASVAVMRQALVPGISEQELWSHLHAENIKRGGEWIETRLLSSGPRTNPWFAECSSRVIQRGDLVAFDTDLIGPYGYCCDVSRTWICDAAPTTAQKDLYRLAAEQIQVNADLLQPGLSFAEFSDRAFQLPERFRPNRYSVVLHGVGLCDEYPAVPYPEDAEFAYDGVFQPSMVVSVESYIGLPGGPDGVKLEEQFLITDSGAEMLFDYPLESAFLV
ncbi:Xaa-Pro peptidase family protein [soil metagenome]